MSDFFSLQDQVAVITGGKSGIGLKATQRFIASGAKVLISGRKDGTEIAEPKEIAAMIHFLASNNYGFINSQAIAADGGFTAGMSINANNTLVAE